MITQTARTITVRIDKQKFQQTITVLPVLILIMVALAETVAMNMQPLEVGTSPQAEADSVSIMAPTQALAYPVRGSDLNPSLFAVQLPPPPLDALPYEVREPLSNGTSVPVKKRWLWLPDGAQIAVSETADGSLNIDVPVGALWWKEFYIETDRGTFLIERRIIERTVTTTSNPDGWVYYSSHYLPADISNTQLLTISSTSDEASAYMFQPQESLPTQQQSNFIEVRFEDARGLEYPYVFPGQTQCASCHNGAAGAYPNAASNPIFVFGLHPNNLTPESFTALVERGWIADGERLLTPGYLETRTAIPEPASVDTLTHEVLGILRNNCASCHNSSPRAAASFTAFQVDPNTNYNTDELVALLSGNGRMVANAFPLVTPGVLSESEIWLRLNGLEGRRRMPPLEGGLPEVDPKIINLFEAWITQLDTQ